MTPKPKMTPKMTPGMTTQTTPKPNPHKPLEPLKEVVSISDMARLVGLSRGRFYQLVNEGIFPPPSRIEATTRPFYSREQQAQCLTVRRTNCGVNGRPILFYCRRQDGRPDNVPRGRERRDRSSRPSPQNTFLCDLRDGLERLGMASVSDSTILTAVNDCYPDGHDGNEGHDGNGGNNIATILATVFRHLSCQDSPDNVTR